MMKSVGTHVEIEHKNVKAPEISLAVDEITGQKFVIFEQGGQRIIMTREHFDEVIQQIANELEGD